VKTPLVLKKRPAEHQYRVNAAVYFATGIWPTGFSLRLRWTTAGDTGKSLNPLEHRS